MHYVLRLSWLGLFLCTACGSPEHTSSAQSHDERALLATGRSLLRALASEEKAAAELARGARQHDNTGRSFSDYVSIQQRLHEELGAQLQALDPGLGAVGMSEAGAAMQAALEGLEGEALVRRYYALQRPWQQAVLRRLQSDELPAAYRQAARQRWGRDLAALEALDR